MSGSGRQIAENAMPCCGDILRAVKSACEKEVCDMYDMINNVPYGRMPVGSMPMQGSVRNVRGRSAAIVTDPISLASASKRAGIRRAAGSTRICGVRTSGERRCVYR